MIINIEDKKFEIKEKVVSAKLRKELRSLDEKYSDVLDKFKKQVTVTQDIVLKLTQEEKDIFNRLKEEKNEYTAWLYAYDKHPELIEMSKELVYTPQDYTRHEEYYFEYFKTAFILPDDLTVDDVFDKADYEEVMLAVNSFRIKTLRR